MKRFYFQITLIFLFLFSIPLNAQISFVEDVTVPFDPVFYGSTVFADIDGDNDQDILITGFNVSNQEISKLYTNDGAGNFTLVSGTPFDGVQESSIAFADIDGDNDQDVLITGYNGSGPISKLYSNDGLGNFTLIAGTPFDGVRNGSIAFADVDGDNDQDVLITGLSSSGSISKLYINDGLGNFAISLLPTPFFGVSVSSIAFADIDGDNDQDVLITGFSSTGPSAKLYSNDGIGNFTLLGSSFDGVARGAVAFADIDGDNDQDLLITGLCPTCPGIFISKLYNNDGSGNFTLVSGVPFSGVYESSIAFSDVDGDNDQDVLITGIGPISELYANDGSGGFTLVSGTPFHDVQESSIAFADIDGDNDQDVIITGSSNTGNVSKLYHNGSFSVNLNIIINEVDADTPGTDTLEFVELYDGGVGNASLDGLELVLFNGSGDASYNVIDLTGFSTDADGYFVIGSALVPNVDLVAFTSNGIQNGADAVALYNGFAGGSVTTTNLIDAFVYDTNDSDDAGLLALLNPGEAQINEDGSGDKDIHSNQRLPNGSGGARNTSTYTQISPTPGAENGASTLVDADGDGFTDDVDCDDNDAAINPDADEICDGIDNDCDGDIDQADADFVDNVPPTVVCNDITVELDATGNYTLTQNDIDAIGAGSTDACGAVTFSVDNDTFDCSNVGSGSTSFSNLIISEYIEGSGNNKCIEIYNGTGVDVDLGENVPFVGSYRLDLHSNGAGFPSAMLPLTGILADGDVLVICNSGADSNFLSQADLTNNTVINFNGDDTIVLSRGGNPIDVFGEFGVDPGSEWNINGNNTQNRTLVRNADVTGFAYAAGFPSLGTEWTEFPENTSSNLGSHTVAGSGSSPTVTLTVTDSNGNTATCQATITVEDNTPPIAACQDITVQLDASGVWSTGWGDINNNSTDNCGIATYLINGQDSVQWDCSNIGTNIATLTVIDESGNESTCTATVTVEDNVPPTVVCNDITVQLDASGNYTLSQADIDAIGAGSFDACGAVSFAVDNDSFDCSDVSSGGNATPSIWINEIHYDNSGGDINEAIEVVANFDAAAYSVVLYNGSGGGTYGSTLDLGSDFTLNTVSGFNIYSIILPANGLQNGAPDGLALVDGSNVAVEFLNYEGGTITATNGPASGMTSTNIGVGETSGTVIGTSLQKTGTGSDSAAFSWGGSQTATFGSPNNGQTLSSGASASVILTVTDSNGNTATCEATITVEDNTPPIAVCQDITVQLDAGGVWSTGWGDINNNSTDNCGIATYLINGQNSVQWDCSNIGTNIATLTVIDESGNESTCTATVTVEDNVPPTVVCNDITVQLDASGNYTLSQADIDAIGAGSFDACGAVSFAVDNDSFDCSDVSSGGNATPSIWINEIHYDNSGGDINEAIEVVANFDAAAYSVVLYNGSGGGTYGSTLDLGSDFTLNTVSGFNIYSIILPANGLQNGAPDGLALVDGSNVAVEFLNYEGGTITATNGPASGMTSTNIGVGETSGTVIGTSLQKTGTGSDAAAFSWGGSQTATFGSPNNGQTLSSGASASVTLTVTDSNGNTATCEATITVEDNTPPTVVCNSYDVELDATGSYTLSQADIDAIGAGSTDACGIADISVSPNVFSCSDVGSVTVTVTVTDNNGNLSTCTTTVEVEDNISPTVVCNDITVELDASGNYTLSQADIEAIGAGSSDACGAVSLTVDNNTFDCSDVVASGPVVATDLFISEYVEGSSNNKCIELFNGTGNTVDLSNYSLRIYFNGNTSPGNTLNLSGSLNDGDTYVICDNDATIFTGDLSAGGSFYNGDDAIELRNGSNPIDIFGRIGEDPGAQWQVGSDETQNQTLRRNSNILSGNIDNASGFPSLGTEWTEFAQDDATGLGSHSISGGNLNSPTVILTVTDVNGNVGTCEATVIVQDNTLPTIVCNAITVALDDTGNYSLSSSDIDDIANGSNDACGIASLSVSPESFTCGEIGFNTVTLTVTDNNGNVNTCTTTVNVVDTIAPIVICQDLTIPLDANGSASIVAADIDGGSTDACSPVTLSISQDTFDCDDVNATVPINDLFISEYIEGSSNNKCIEIFNGTGSAINLAGYTLVRYSNGNTNGTNINLSGTIANGDVHVVCNSSSTGTFLAQADQTTGSLSHNGDDAYELRNGTNIIDIFGSVGEDPGAEWNVAGNETQDRTLRRNISVTKGNLNNTVGFPSLGTEWTEYPQNNLDDLGMHTVDARGIEVVLTATDAYGNSDSCVAIVRLEDNVAPEIVCIPDTVKDTDLGVCNYTVVGTELDATFTDNCTSGTITNDYNNSASLDGAIFEQGPTLVTWTVDDGNGQVVSCSTTVTVEDNEAPIVDCLSLQVQLDEFGNGSIDIDDINGNSTDNCEIASVSLSEMNFDCSDIGGDLDGLIISEYIDGAGDNDCIEIFNGTGNTVNLNGVYRLKVYADGATAATYDVSLLGTIGDRDVYVVCFGANAGASQADQISGFAFDGNDAVALVKDGNAVDVVGVIGDNPGSGWAAGGVSTAGTTLVRNLDILQGNINNFVANLPTEWTQYSQDTYSNLGNHDIEITELANNVILTVTDTSGNVSTCEGNVTVVDFVPPTPVCQNIIVQLEADGTVTVAPSQVDNGSTDNCGVATLSLDVTEFDCSNIGVNPVVLTVTDVNGNTATCNATVIIQDTTPPTVITEDITIQLDGNGSATITADDVDDGSNDACGVATTSVSPSSFDCSNIGDNTVTLTVVDLNGNTATGTAIVTVEDMVNPIAVCNAISIYLNPDGTYTLSETDIDTIANGSNDNCDNDLTYSISPSSFTCAEEGDNTVTLTVTDDYGNTDTCTTTVTVEGSFPEVTISQSELPEFCQGAAVVLTATSAEAVEYLWNSGEDTASIEVEGNGIYGVLVTSATNCTAYAEFEVTGFDPGALVAAYTILAQEEVFLHGNNLVQSGGVGAMNPNTGNIKLHQATNVVGFGQAPSFDLNQGSTIGSQVFAAANPTIPGFVVNTLSNNSSPDVNINNNQTVTLTGSVYDMITVRQNATVIFTQSNVYINDLKTFDGASIEFDACANVFINEKFMLAKNGTINADDPNKVVFYVNDDVQIEQGSNVRASIHANDNELLVKGYNTNGNGNNAGEPTYMTGLFIANRVHGNKNVIWNADDLCDPCPVDQPLTGDSDITDNARLGIDLEVIAYPNPSNNNFNLKLKTAISNENAQVQVFDMNNRIVHKGDFKFDGTHVFGDKLDGGVYIVKVTQSGQEKTVRLVRY